MVATGTESCVIEVLRVQDGGQIVLGGEEVIHIGRALPYNDKSPRLVLAGKSVSNHHCEVGISETGKPKIRDLGSRNGTWYQGMKISPNIWVEIDTGETIGVSHYRFIIVRLSRTTWELCPAPQQEVTCQRPTDEEMVAAATDIFGLTPPPAQPSDRHVLAVLHLQALWQKYRAEFDAIKVAINQSVGGHPAD